MFLCNADGHDSIIQWVNNIFTILSLKHVTSHIEWPNLKDWFVFQNVLVSGKNIFEQVLIFKVLLWLGIWLMKNTKNKDQH